MVKPGGMPQSVESTVGGQVRAKVVAVASCLV